MKKLFFIITCTFLSFAFTNGENDNLPNKLGENSKIESTNFDNLEFYKISFFENLELSSKDLVYPCEGQGGVTYATITVDCEGDGIVDYAFEGYTCGKYAWALIDQFVESC